MLIFFLLFPYSGLSSGIYTTNTAEACHFVASDAQVNIVVAENDIQLQKFLQVSTESVPLIMECHDQGCHFRFVVGGMGGVGSQHCKKNQLGRNLPF